MTKSTTEPTAEIERLKRQNAQLEAIRLTLIDAIMEPDKKLRAALMQVVYESAVRYGESAK